MPGMEGMDCCKKAMQHENFTLEVSSARLCCALNCSEPGTTGSSRTQLPQPSTVQAVVLYPTVKPPAAALAFYNSHREYGPPPYSHPAYIRHLALLI